jgi:hypothetical protein
LLDCLPRNLCSIERKLSMVFFIKRANCEVNTSSVISGILTEKHRFIKWQSPIYATTSWQSGNFHYNSHIY